MRSFTLSIFATLAFAAFSFAAPMIGGASPVNAVAARGAGANRHTKEVSLEVVLTAAIDVITPITEKLTCIKSGDGATIEVISPIIAELKVAIKKVIVDVKVLVSLPLEKILCTAVGGVLDALAIAKLLACLLNLVFGACGSILGVVSVSVKAELCPLLSDVGCLLGSLLCDVLGLVSSLVSQIILCLLPQITGCYSILKLLDIKIIISVLGLIL